MRVHLPKAVGTGGRVCVAVFAAAVLSGCGQDGDAPSPVLPYDDGDDPAGTQAAFVDTALEAAVRAAVGQPSGALTLEILLSLTELEARGRGISALGGVQQLARLQLLDLADNQIGDLTPLAPLAPHLAFLDLSANAIEDLSPLAQLSSLEVLGLELNRIQDLGPLMPLAGLVSVDLTGNPLGERSVAELIPELRERGVTVTYVAAGDSGEDGGVPAEPDDPRGRIAFSACYGSSRRDNCDIYVMDGVGGYPVQLTDTPDREREPDWDPDGSRIAFVRGGDLGRIYLMEVMDGGYAAGIRPIGPDDGDNRSPAWSPDGTRIAFSRATADSFANLYVMNADGSDIRRLTEYPSNDLNPCWSPDGTQIAFSSRREGSPSEDIHIIDVDGHRVTRIAWEEVRDLGPAWSPDGTRLAISAAVRVTIAGSTSSSARIHVHEFLGEARTEVTRGYHWAPEWSPDGQRIAFVEGSFSSAGIDEHISVVDLATSDVADLSVRTWDERREGPYHDYDPSWTATNWPGE